MDLNGKQEQLQEQGTESIQEKQAGIFLLAYQQQWAKTKGNPRTGGRADLPALHYHHGHHWTRRESSGGGAERLRRGAARRGVAERRIQASTSRAREGPALARRGLVPGRARFGISRGVCCASACAAWGGWRVDRSQPPSDGRSPRPRLPPPHLTSLASPANVHAATSTHRGVFTSPALLPAAGCRGERPSSRHVAPQ